MTAEHDPAEAETGPQNRDVGRLVLRLSWAAGAALIAILAGQLVARYWFELPELYRIEHEADARAVARIRNAVARRLDDLGSTTREYAAWDAAYEFMAGVPGTPETRYFLESEIGPATFRNNQINGIFIVDNERRLVHAANQDLETGAPSPALDLDYASLDGKIYEPRTPGAPVNSGIADSNIGHILFASCRIVNTAEDQPPRGTMVFWRKIDKAELGAIARLIGQKFTFIPIAEARGEPRVAHILARLQSPGVDFTPRDGQFVYWLLNDFTGNPAFLVQQTVVPRSFNPGLVSAAFLVEALSSVVVLLCVVLFFSRSIVNRVVRASTIMRQIRETGAFHHRVPVSKGRPDELDEMFQHFNALLVRVARQDEDLREQNRRLAEMSQQDTLTGIPNRRSLNENFDRFWRQAVRAKRPISVLMVDVDYFKPYNDRYGHLAGDRVLKQIAQALQENLHRATDFVARYGGEEFCVVLTETTLEHALRVAEGLRKAIIDAGLRHEDSPHGNVVTISIGVASAMADQTVVHLDLMRAADRALYRAKDLGRNRVVHIEEDATDPGDRSHRSGS